MHLGEDGDVLADDRVNEVVAHGLHELWPPVERSIFACGYNQQHPLLAALLPCWVPAHQHL